MPVKKTVAKKSPEIPQKTVVKARTLEKAVAVTLAHFDISGEKKTAVKMPAELVDKQVAPTLVEQMARVHLSNQRQGTLSTKTRSEVTGSTRKIYRQKVTGRARHGSITAPIFVGGGIVFGPKPRDFSLKLPQKMRRKVLRGLLTTRAQDGNLSIVSGLGEVSGKTRDLVAMLKKIKIWGKSLLVVIVPEMKLVVRSGRNIEKVTVRPVNTLSAWDILASEQTVFAKEALDILTKDLSQK